VSRKQKLTSGPMPSDGASASRQESSPPPPPLRGGEGERPNPAPDSATSTEAKPPSAGQSGGRAARSFTARGATDAPGAVTAKKGERGRFSAPRKAEAIMRLVRGESLDALSRELGVTAATLSEWREKFLTAGQAALKAREASPQDEEVHHLKAMVGDLTMRLEVSREAVTRLSGGRPFVPWRSRK
jgi:transposase-like protein